MISRTLWIRADATSRMGIGHTMRCMALAEAWKRRGGEVCFATRCENPMILERISDEGFAVLLLEDSRHQENGLEQALSASWGSGDQDPAWVVLDGYQFGPDYQRAVREAAKRLLVVDDYNHLPRYEADILLNQNIEAEHLRYQAAKECAFLLGPPYALVRREFVRRKEAKEIPFLAKRVLVTVGGSDPDRVTLKILEGLSRLEQPEMEVKIVVGPANPCGAEVKRAAAKSKLRGETLETGKDMPELMAWADLAVTAGGSTCMELAFMGVPSLVIALAENQKQVMQGFANRGAAVALGWHVDLDPTAMAAEIDALARDRSRRESFSRLGQALVDGLGATRVAEAMDPTDITLRHVQEQDCELVWRWANEPRARAVSFSSNPIPWEDHRQWFAEKLHSKNGVFYMATNQHGTPVGQVRVDPGESGSLISVSLDRDFRSLGLGSRVIRAASERAIRERHLERIDALIKAENSASVMAFSKAGYKSVGKETHQGCAAVRMRYGGEARE